MEFFTKYKRPEKVLEVFDDESKTEPGMYAPLVERFEEFRAAGKRLRAQRVAQYDYGPKDKDDGFLDPSRSPGFDLADTGPIVEAIAARASSRAIALRKEVSNGGVEERKDGESKVGDEGKDEDGLKAKES